MNGVVAGIASTAEVGRIKMKSASQESRDGDRRARLPLFVALLHDDESVGARREADREGAQRERVRKRHRAVVVAALPERTRSNRRG